MITIKAEGINRAQRKLSEFSQSVTNKITKRVLKKESGFIAQAIQRAAPVSKSGSYRQQSRGSKAIKYPAGSLKNSVVVEDSKNNQNQPGVVGVYVLVGGRKRLNPKGAYYADWVERGYNRGSVRVSGKKALAIGAINKAEYERRDLLRRRNALRNIAAGKPPSKSGGLQVRIGGKRVGGKHFVERAFEAHKAYTIKAIESGLKEAYNNEAKRLGL